MNAVYQISGGKVIEGIHELPVASESDVVVAGGGPAGFAAAVSAARAGANVTLVESQAFLGGVATSVMMAALVGAKYADGISGELIGKMSEKGGSPDLAAPRVYDSIPFDPETFKEAALEMVCEAGVNLMLYTMATNPIVVDGKIKGIVVENKSGRSAVLAERVIDCTGDADLAYSAGAPVAFGRESDHKMRPFSLLFRLGGVDVKKILRYVENDPDELQPQFRNGIRFRINSGEEVIQRLSGFYKLVEKAKAKGELYPECHYFRIESIWINRGTVICNTSRFYYVDGTNASDLTKGEIECRKQIKKLFAFAKKYVPGFENAFVIDVAPRLGIRETRRIIGEYTLTNGDAYNDARFDDAFMTVSGTLVKGSLPAALDVHMPEPIEGSEKDLLERYPERVPREDHTYQIPYRVLLTRDVDNLLVAGRTIAVSHMIDEFTRLMIPCMRFGQVAGAAAALSVRNAVSPKNLDFKFLKEELIRQGLTL